MLAVAISKGWRAHILSGKLHVAEQERDRLSGENERLELQNQQLKGSQSRMVEEHARTLERFNLMWRQKCPVSWDEVLSTKSFIVSTPTLST